MRRLAKQDRQDRVRSSRDYQEIHERRGLALRLDPSRRACIVFCADAADQGNVPFLGVGGYFKTDLAVDLQIRLSVASGSPHCITYRSSTKWGRFGVALRSKERGTVSLAIESPGQIGQLHIWGLNCGWLTLPDVVIRQGGANEELLNLTNTVPEGLYLSHEVPVAIDPAEDEWVDHGFRQSPEVKRQQSQRTFLEVFPSPALVMLFPCHTHSSHTHCRPLRYKHKRGRTWAEVHSEWEIYRARLRSLECREPALTLAPEVKKAIGIDITEFKGSRYKPFDDLLDGILCAYLAYYFWHWGREGYWVVGDAASGYIVLPRCQVQKCPAWPQSGSG